MAELFTNNASSTLAAGITAVATSATVQSGEGAKYPSPTGSDFFRVLLFKKSTGEWEIALCTARSGDILTLTRAQEGTTAIAFDADDLIELRPTAAFFASLTITSANIRDDAFNYDATDSGTADAYAVQLTPAVTSNFAGLRVKMKAANPNTGASTLQADAGAADTIKKFGNQDLVAGDIITGGTYYFIHDGTYWQLLNPSQFFGKQTIWVPATAMQPTVSNGCSTLNAVETTADRPDMLVLDFDAVADEHAQFQIAFPKQWNKGTITYQVFWTSAGANSNGVAWALQGVAVADNDTIDAAYGVAVVVTDDNQAAAEDCLVTAESAEVTIAGSPGDNELCYFRIFRDVSDANDDMTEDARLLGVKIHFTTNRVNDL